MAQTVSTHPVTHYRPTIGLEVHLQLKTQSKIFCGCPTTFGAEPNSQVCPVCLGLPGVLPVLNRKVLLYGVKVALALNCRIGEKIVFHRKNYFYPDLPKGYQISQYDLPLGTEGWVEMEWGKVRIRRVHMEEDAGKLLHKPDGKSSLVDLNRAGVPLLEIVSEPDIHSPQEAYGYLKTLKGILGYLDVSDCDMEKGSLRCDANISVASGPDSMGTKVEIKNLNSFRAVARALAYEVERQTRLLENKEAVVQETRLWDDERGVTYGMRTKEYAHDYRYFPEPDLVPFDIASEEVEAIRQSLPELPKARMERFVRTYGIPLADARILTASRSTADYYEACVKSNPQRAKAVANWILGEMARQMNERNLEEIGDLGFPPPALVELIELVESGRISGKMAKEVFVECLRLGESPSDLVRARGLLQVTDAQTIRAVGRRVIEAHGKAVADYRKGKTQALMFLVGQLMRQMQGTASPDVAQRVIRELLEEEDQRA
jgi:aspartyl-tRNA(Asn)/glutamyl-tRNA(Gln) amidotransferase subunit B